MASADSGKKPQEKEQVYNLDKNYVFKIRTLEFMEKMIIE